MTDDAPDERQAPTGEPFAVVLTAEYGEWLEERLRALEGRAPASLSVDDVASLQDTLRKMHDRLGRHRDELEQIKREWARLLDYVHQYVPATTPAFVTEGGSPL